MSGDKDFAVNAVGQIGGAGAIQATGLGGSQISRKPSYLLTLEPSGAKGKVQRFITLDKPDLLQGFVQVKGVYLNESEDEIINNVSTILTSIKKELVLEVMLPWHRICSIRSLVFNAIKNQTLIR